MTERELGPVQGFRDPNVRQASPLENNTPCRTLRAWACSVRARACRIWADGHWHSTRTGPGVHSARAPLESAAVDVAVNDWTGGQHALARAHKKRLAMAPEGGRLAPWAACGQPPHCSCSGDDDCLYHSIAAELDRLRSTTLTALFTSGPGQPNACREVPCWVCSRVAAAQDSERGQDGVQQTSRHPCFIS